MIVIGIFIIGNVLCIIEYVQDKSGVWIVNCCYGEKLVFIYFQVEKGKCVKYCKCVKVEEIVKETVLYLFLKFYVVIKNNVFEAYVLSWEMFIIC